MRYHNFDLWICRRSAEGRYPLRASTEALGEVPDDWMEIDLQEEAFAALSGRIQSGKEEQGDLLRFGTLLHTALFRSGNGQIDRLFQRCLGIVQRKDDAVRIRLRIDDPEIAALPWEFLYSAERKQHLAASLDTVLVRYLEMPTPVRDLETGFPLCLLVVIPSGSGLDTEKEKAQLEQALKPLAKRVEPVWLEGCVTIGALDDALCAHPYHLIHFIGHGEFEEAGASIFLNETDNSPDRLVPVGENRFAQLFANHRSIKLVVLNACEGATASQSRPLAGVAPQLVRQGVPAVVAMQFSIFDDVAIAFSHRFYAGLLTGYQAGRIDVAMSQARNRLLLAFPDQRDIGAPVLFMRAPEGVLFSVPPVRLREKARDQLWTPRPKRQHEAARLRTIESNVRAYREGGQEKEAEEEHDELRRFQKRLRYRRMANVAAAVAALFIFVLGWVNAFDLFFGMQTRSETLLMWLGGLIRDKPLHPDIVLVAIDENTASQLGEPAENYPPWRDTHGRLVDQLVEAGAKAIVFDFTFGSRAEVSEETNAFAESMRRAANQGVAVVVGATETDGSGTFLVDQSLGEAAHGVGHLWVEGVSCVSLGTWREGKLQEPALSLMAAAAWFGEDMETFDFHLEHLYRWGESSVHIGSHTIRFTESRMPKPEVVQFLLTSPIRGPGTLRDPEHCFLYETVHRQMTDDERKRRFQNKLVLIGDRLTKGEKKPIRGTLAWRYGMEIHASAISDLIAGTSVRKPFYFGMILISLLLAAAGVYLGWRLAPLPPKKRRWIFFTACLIFFMMALVAYGWIHYLLDVLTGLVVLWVSYRVGRYIANLLEEPYSLRRSHGNETNAQS